MRTTIIVFIAIAFIATSCKKYPDGPDFSLRSKTERLSNTWKIDKWYDDGVDVTSNIQILLSDFSLAINKSGSYSQTYKGLGFLPVSETGTWAFNGDKSKVIFTRTSPQPQTTTEWTILMLKEEELWGQYTDTSSSVIKVQLIPN